MTATVGNRTLDEVVAGIAEGWTLPSAAYTDDAVYRLELDRIFDHSWQYVGHTDRLATPGSYIAERAGRVPVVVVRREDGSLAGYVNVCPHRGHEVVTQDGCRRSLQCPYHGWTYGLDGSLRAAPRSETEPGFDRTAIRLRAVQVDTWGPLVFVNPDLAAEPLAVQLGPLPALAAARGLRLGDHPLRARRTWPLDCNWKVTLDNNTECYHCATIHPGFSSGYHVDATNYEVTTFERSFRHRSPPKTGAATDGSTDFHLYYLWPNFMLSARGNDHYYVYCYRPTGARTTTQVNDYCFGGPRTDDDVLAEIDLLRALMAEDWSAFASVQRGLESGALDRGRLLAVEERLLRQFHTLWGTLLGGAPATTS